MSSNFISIQGNIGSGKSTILKIIKESLPELTILDEPLASWEKVGENGSVNLLKLYYSDPKRWGFTFQIYAFMTRLTKWTEFSQLNSPETKVSERSLLSDRYIFASIMRDMGILSQLEHEAYLSCYKDMVRMQKISKVGGVIYVQCDPKTCSQRIKKRAREGESEIPLDYLQKLHEKHQEWLNPSKIQTEETLSSSSQNSQQNKQKTEQDSRFTSYSTSITEQRVLVIDNKAPIDKSRLVSQIRNWLKGFQQAQ